jgi:hypothetical protein
VVPGAGGRVGPAPGSEGGVDLFYQVGEKTTSISGRTILLKDVFPKLGGKWDSDARVWRMPAERTHELVTACEEKGIRASEVGADKSKELELF